MVNFPARLTPLGSCSIRLQWLGSLLRPLVSLPLYYNNYDSALQEIQTVRCSVALGRRKQNTQVGISQHKHSDMTMSLGTAPVRCNCVRHAYCPLRTLLHMQSCPLDMYMYVRAYASVHALNLRQHEYSPNISHVIHDMHLA